MTQNYFFVISLKYGRLDLSCDNFLRFIEKIKIMRAQFCVCQRIGRRIFASAGTSGSLCIISRRRRNIP